MEELTSFSVFGQPPVNLPVQATQLEQESVSEEIAIPPSIGLSPAATVLYNPERVVSTPTFAGEFTELNLMPIRCYSCGKILNQLSIENSLHSGQRLSETMDQLNYRRICCRNIIMSSPSIVRLQKKLQSEQQAISAFRNLTLGTTSGMPTQQFLAGPERVSNIGIIESAPPGIPQQGGICFSQMNDGFTDPELAGPDAYEYYVRQLDPTGSAEAETE